MDRETPRPLPQPETPAATPPDPTRLISMPLPPPTLDAGEDPTRASLPEG